MSKNDDGHYELVIGNRQLVSGFFVLIILFAIFLTLGYVLGRNSVVVSDAPEIATRDSGAAEGPRSPVRPATAASMKPSATEAAPAVETDAPARPTPVTTAAAQPDAVQPAATPSPIVTPRETTPPKPAVETPAAARTPVTIPETQTSRAQEIINAQVRVITPRQGDAFVQVAAVSRAEAELLAEKLNRRGYRAHISEVPGKDLYRVLIGPFETPAKLNETRAKLTQEGISSIVQRY